MKRIFNSLFLTLAVVATALGFSASAAESTDEPIITFKTSIYETYGESNEFSVLIGGTDSTAYIDVDCGYGKVEYQLEPAVYDSISQGISGTLLSCKVSSAGVVKIYGDASLIDYFNADGCYITELDISKLTNLEILSLQHNELKSLDLTNFNKLSAIYLTDNEFTAETPLVIGANKPNLAILEIDIIKYMDKSFNLSDYPSMLSFTAYHNESLESIDPTGCPYLLRLTLDVTNVKTVDVSKNPYLQILNVSETGVTSLDLSNNPNLTELYCTHESGTYNTDAKFHELDVTNNPKLTYLFASNNSIKKLDLTKCPNLVSLYVADNYIDTLDLTQNASLSIVDIRNNCLTFATLPFDPGTWSDYQYTQRSISMNSAYVVGSVIDLSDKVLREGTSTYCYAYSVSDDDPANPVELDTTYYNYSNGVITLKKTLSDRMYFSFINDGFPNTILYTGSFKVQSESDFGKPNLALYFNTTMSSGETLAMSIGMSGASADSPKELLVDFGNGTTQSISITTSEYSATPNVTATRSGYGPVRLYVNEGDALTAFGIDNVYVSSIDVSGSSSLVTLSVTNANLYTINLEKNKDLRTLDLSNNNLTSIDMTGLNSYFPKNVLHYMNFSNNKLTSITFSAIQTVYDLDISNNAFTEFSFTDAENMVNLDISNNALTEIKLTDCDALTNLNISNNQIASITMPEENNIKVFNCANNQFTIATLPELSGFTSYEYAPQSDLKIATKAPGIDLSEQIRTIGDATTTFTWKDASGNTLVEGTDYTMNDGYTRFLNTTVGNVYCELSHTAFPDFTGENAFKTTQVLASEMPTNLIASFNTTTADQEVTLSLAADVDATGVYFDWNGDGNMTQYILGTTYRIFTATTKGERTVNVYTYEATDNVKVFSITGASMSSFDGSKLTGTSTVSVNNAGLSEIILPENNVITELSLAGNKFTQFDPSKYPNLIMLQMSSNQLTTIDLSQNKALQTATFSYNNMSSITLDNPRLWGLSVDNNNFSEISLGGAPNLSQLGLYYNKLKELNLDNNNAIVALGLSNNQFTFKTLPPVKSSYVYYVYSDQQNISVTPTSGKVDLSDQAVANGVETVYNWFLGEPIINDDGELEGEVLIEDTEYNVADGVTTFHTTLDNVVCVMTNTSLPNLFLYTDAMDITEVGVEGIFADANASIIVDGHNIIVKAENGSEVKLFNIKGYVIFNDEISDSEIQISDVATGVYIVTVGNKGYKLLVK